MRNLKLAGFALGFALLCVSFAPTLAQEATPVADRNAPTARGAVPAERLDLAAIALAGEDMPAGFQLSFQTYIRSDRIAEQFLAGAVTASQIEETGLRWYYETQYASADGQQRIRSYVQEYGSASGARAGFALLEDEDLFAQDGLMYVDRRGLDVGEEPSEVTVATFESPDAMTAGTTLDATYRIGRLLVGVSIDSVGATVPDEDLLLQLALRLEERANAVMDGTELEGVDPRLATAVLEFDDALVVQEGYMTLFDSMGAAAPAAALAAYESGYMRTVALGAEVDPNLPLPIVSIVISSFSTENAALNLLTEADTLTPAFSDLSRVRIDSIPGSSAVVAYSFVNPFSGTSVDSFRVLLVVESDFIVIDLHGGPTLDAAQQAAMSIAEQQAACLADAISCGDAALPGDLLPPTSS